MTKTAGADTQTKERIAQTMAEALRETDLTVEEAEELRERLEQPYLHPARPPRDIPTTDSSLLRS